MNPVWALPLVVAMQTRSAGVSPRPVAWAAQSPRPSACLAAPGLWEVSRQALWTERCRELSRVQALLLRVPEQALSRASALVERAPELPQARVLRGRAALRVGDAEAALADLLPFLDADPALLADPGALLDGGRAALGSGNLAAAGRFYRRLGSGAALLPSQTEQAVAYLEIAATLLAGGATSGDEALAYLREARRRSPGTGFTSLVVGLTALAWSKQGHEAEALGALHELGDPAALDRFERSKLVVLPPGVFDALAQLAAPRGDSPKRGAR